MAVPNPATRRGASKQRRRSGTGRRKPDCLDVLTADEALAVLRALLASNPVVPPAREAANALLASVSFVDVAKSVCERLTTLGLDDMEAGPGANGYVEPSEGAWLAIENAIAPYLDDLTRRTRLRHEDEATELCKGIVLGLYRAERRGFELREYADDCASELAGRAVAILQRRRRQHALPRAFVQKLTPQWTWLVE